MLSFVVFVASAVLLHVAVRLVYTRIVHPPFNNIAGPSSGNLLSGMSELLHLNLPLLTKFLLLGNMKVMYGHNAWDFLRSLRDDYGPVSRIYGFFRVGI